MKTIIYSEKHIGGLKLSNRLIVSPMQQNQGTPEAFATDYHVNHYGRLAGGAAMVMLESTGVSPNGRLFSNDIGIFTDEHVTPLKKVVEAVHAKNTPVFIQLTHGGRKSWRNGGSRLLAPSPIAYDDEYGIPEEMSLSEIRSEIDNFRLAARRSLEAGFDGIEVHAAHGHLVHQFLSPLSNHRTDEYGGSPEKRTRFLRDILEAVRSEVGRDYPVLIRVSASDFTEGGLTPVDVAKISASLEPLINAVDVSSGGLLPVNPAATPEGYQVPYASIIKQYVSIPIIAVGKIYTKELAEFILTDRLADFIAIGRPLLGDPEYIRSTFFTSEVEAVGVHSN
ncbi:NADH:flavin oxidoreductase [Paenibacillus favisporus]|uniref:oxidoreductase n=1 Tax=Paenibacillus favisporus TaxID=221028 RepID=UPI002DBB3265|nr:NADH:flavin oxidoreductase [Paenibacillus favisporus]MEC0173799.1 NADH:flavin oxidoreductase [Paenibacillus favisporus]